MLATRNVEAGGGARQRAWPRARDAGFGNPRSPGDDDRIQRSDIDIEYVPHGESGLLAPLLAHHAARSTQSAEECVFQLYRISVRTALDDAQVPSGVFEPHSELTPTAAGPSSKRATIGAPRSSRSRRRSLSMNTTDEHGGGRRAAWHRAPRRRSLYSHFEINYPEGPARAVAAVEHRRQSRARVTARPRCFTRRPGRGLARAWHRRTLQHAGHLRASRAAPAAE